MSGCASDVLFKDDQELAHGAAHARAGVKFASRRLVAGRILLLARESPFANPEHLGG